MASESQDLGQLDRDFKQLKNFKTPSQKTANINVIKIAVKNLKKEVYQLSSTVNN